MINIAVVGNVDAGKSTLISTLKHSILDDGNGSARTKIINLKHELQSGRTSSVTVISLNKINLIDLAGHEKYLRTTLTGLTRYLPDYAILVIDTAVGISKMTLEHLYVCMALRIPLIVVLNKIDRAPEHKLKESLSQIERLLKRNRVKFLYKVKTKEVLTKFEHIYFNNACTAVPIFFTSCKAGNGLNLMSQFLKNLPIKYANPALLEFLNNNEINTFFHIYKVYFKVGIGHILYGRLLKGEIKVNQHLKLGPKDNNYIEVRVRSIHNSDSELVSMLETNQNGCIAIKSLNNKIKLTKRILQRNKVCIGDQDLEVMVKKFEAVIMISNHATTITPGFQTCIHTHLSQATATLIESEKQVLRSKDRAKVSFEFLKSQFLYTGTRILFREGKVRGIGIVTKV